MENNGMANQTPEQREHHGGTAWIPEENRLRILHEKYPDDTPFMREIRRSMLSSVPDLMPPPLKYLSEVKGSFTPLLQDKADKAMLKAKAAFDAAGWKWPDPPKRGCWCRMDRPLCAFCTEHKARYKAVCNAESQAIIRDYENDKADALRHHPEVSIEDPEVLASMKRFLEMDYK